MAKTAEEKDDVLQAERLAAAKADIVAQIRQIIVGQDEAVEQMLVALFARGHCLIEGVPGLAKTLLVSSLARILDLKFSRIQFTPDLMPSDVTGSEIIQENPETLKREFRFIPGPVFANLVLADEINRTPPKTQAALLQAMQEYQVTTAGETRDLPLPFFVMATQNPIEQEGTYPLPEAQLDRFFLQIVMDYPSRDEEKRIVLETTGQRRVELKKVLDAREMESLQDLVRRVPVADSAVELAVRLARATRPADAAASKEVKSWLSWGAGPRAAQSLVLGAKSRALLSGRLAAGEDDVRAVAKPVLRHRLVLNFQAEAEAVQADTIIERLLGEIS
ncbi:MAG TPA: MoxR family ATPase [Elusimicrobiota bacterium]|nr:MoxR family ATPase [Elusimicrobiota bacterium]